jgi:hypothetical protein
MRKTHLLAGLGSLLICTSALLATPSGLNNIPTADVTPMGTFVGQAYSNFGNDHDGDFSLGFKTGLDLWGQKFEIGADSHITPGTGGPVVLQFKYQVPQLWQGGNFGIGIANLALTQEDRDRAGDPFTYVVLSQDINGWFRTHAGYGFQTDNNSVLLGLDKTWKVFERDFVLRSDLIQIQNEGQWEGSLGFLYALNKYLVLESWVSQPFDHGDPIFTVKLNFVVQF